MVNYEKGTHTHKRDIDSFMVRRNFVNRKASCNIMCTMYMLLCIHDEDEEAISNREWPNNFRTYIHISNENKFRRIHFRFSIHYAR